MINPIYEDTLMAGWVVLILLGVCMLFSQVPQKPEYKVYNRSRLLTAAAMMVFGAQLLLHWIFFFRIHTPYVATALNLTGFHIEAILFSMSQVSLLNNRYICKRQLRRDLTVLSLTLLTAWPSALLLDGDAQRAVMIVSALTFLSHAVYITFIFFHTYRRAMRWMDNYYSDNVEAFVNWMRHSTFGFICYSMPGALLAFCPQTYNTVYMIVIICLFTYIYISFQNYIINYVEVENVVADVTETEEKEETDNSTEQEASKSKEGNSATAEKVLPPTDTQQDILKKIETWIADGAYRQKGITIDSLIKLLRTNRTYVSNFINTTYKCNFREWITTLRMEYAKSQLVDHPEKTIELIAEEAGFSSSSYFCQQFTKREGMTPTVWRNQERA